MALELKECQQRAVDELFNLLINKENKQINFQAPTGSGKTLIIASLCNKIVEFYKTHNRKIAILFASLSTGELSGQNSEKMEMYKRELLFN